MDAAGLLVAYIKEKGLKMTAQRRHILAHFLVRGKHASPDELYRELRKKHPGIGRATVYRTLHLLLEADLAQSVEFGDGAKRFEDKHRTAHHDHLICTRCGGSFEFFSPALERLQDRLAKRHGFHPQRHRLDIFGLCGPCAGKK